MTAQISDQIELRQHVFTIAGVKGDHLFQPGKFDLEPQPVSSNCWRGYFCQYGLRQGQIILDKLQISLGYYKRPDANFRPHRQFLDITGPKINGVPPQTNKPSIHDAPDELGGALIGLSTFDHKYAFLNNVYEGLDLTVDFSGGILIGDEFIQALFKPSGFQPAWKFRTVYELVFERGRIIKERDVSRDVKMLRQNILSEPHLVSKGSGKDRLRALIKSAFSLDYDL